MSLFEQAADQRGADIALYYLSGIDRREGRYRRAIELNRQALVLFRRAGDRHEEAIVLVNIALLLRLLGRLEEASDHARQALTLFTDIDDRYGQLAALHQLELVELDHGRTDPALTFVGQALALAGGVRRPVRPTLSLDRQPYSIVGERSTSREDRWTSPPRR